MLVCVRGMSAEHVQSDRRSGPFKEEGNPFSGQMAAAPRPLCQLGVGKLPTGASQTILSNWSGI